MFHFRLLLVGLALSSALLAVASQPEPGKDLVGDPLPQSAISRLGTVRWRHPDLVRFAAFLPDGKRIVSVGDDQMIRVWEFPSGKELRRIPVPAGPTPTVTSGGTGEIREVAIDFAAALSSDGKIIATYFQSVLRNVKQKPAEIRLHEVDTGKELPSLITTKSSTPPKAKVPGGPNTDLLSVASLVFSPNGEHLISIDNSGLTRVWDWANAKIVRSFVNPNKGHAPVAAPGPAIVRSLMNPDEKDFVAFSADGNTLMFTGRTNTIHLVDAGTGKEIGPSGHITPVTSVFFMADGNQLATKAVDGSMRRWDVATGKEIGPVIKFPAKGPKTGNIVPPTTAAISPDGKVLAAIRMSAPKGSGVLALLDAATQAEISTISLEVNTQPYVVFAPGNKIVAVLHFTTLAFVKKAVSDQNKIELIDVATGKRLHVLAIPPNDSNEEMSFIKAQASTQMLLFSPDNRIVAFGIDPNNVFLWDTQTGKRSGTVRLPPGAGLENVVFSPDGRCLAVEMNNGTVTLYEVAVPAPRHSFGEPTAKAVPKKGTPALARGPGPGFVLRQPDPGARLAISPDGKLLAVAGPDHLAHIWDIATGRELTALAGHDGTVNAVAFSPDSKLLASASADTTALVWDLSKIDRPAPSAKVLKTAELEQCWQDLLDNDGIKAFAAICDLTASPKESVAFLKDNLKPAASVDAKTIDVLIAQLADDQFKVRDKAAKELVQIGEPIAPAVEKKLQDSLPLETKRRLEELRDRVTSKTLQGERLRLFRAVEVLERIATSEARQQLQLLASGAPGTLLTTNANAALERMAQ
jgi:WD40 repeat protein